MSRWQRFGMARPVFIGNHELKVAMADGTVRQAAAERIFINTGATPVWPKVPGLTPSERIVSSKEAMELAKKAGPPGNYWRWLYWTGICRNV